MSEHERPTDAELAVMASRRAYGYEYNRSPEDLTRCVVQIYPNERGRGPCQCGHRRGHGPEGLFCHQHSKHSYRVPTVGSWGRHLLQEFKNRRRKLDDAITKAAWLDRAIAIVTVATPEAPTQ